MSVSRYAGYANSVIGSIIANQGFIEAFATVKDPETGAPALEPNHISLWSASYFITTILIQFIAPNTADKFGRKFNMWAVTFFLTLVSITILLGPERLLIGPAAPLFF
jgi:MFS family permease